MQELNLPGTNYEFVASTDRPILVICHILSYLKKGLIDYFFMQLSSTRIKTLVLVLLMLCTLVLAAVASFRIGYASLKGVNAPDINPTKKLTKKINSVNTTPKEFIPVSEAKILKQVRVYISKEIEKGKKKGNSQKNSS